MLTTPVEAVVPRPTLHSLRLSTSRLPNRMRLVFANLLWGVLPCERASVRAKGLPEKVHQPLDRGPQEKQRQQPRHPSDACRALRKFVAAVRAFRHVASVLKLKGTGRALSEGRHEAVWDA